MSDAVRIAFHGAARTVTGSKHLLTVGDTRVLLDAGLFQGRKKLREMNWADPAFDPGSVDAVLLSHTHIDHVGYLPRLVKHGLRAPVHCTPAAYELAELMLYDSAKIQEEDARWANKKGFSKHKPALPLYDSHDVKQTLKLRRLLRYNQWLPIDGDGRVRARMLNSGHLLGSGFIELRIRGAGGGRELRVVFSGDIGRFDLPLHLDPRPLPACDVLILESTYGKRLHTTTPLADQLAEPFSRCLGQGGIVLIPAFAVGRSQQVTLVLRRLMKSGQLPDVPIHIDSPMACNATRIYSRFLNKRNIDPDVFEDGRLRLFPERVSLHRSVAQSKKLNNLPGPRIIVSSSGMLSGGRVLHHLRRLAPDKRNLVMLAGYQAPGTRSRDLIDGKGEVKIYGQMVRVRAKVISLQGLSGHADRDELLKWVASAPEAPKRIFLVHGEPDSSKALGEALHSQTGAPCYRPEIGDEYDLTDMLDAL